jgi:serine/threonine protein kinase
VAIKTVDKRNFKNEDQRIHALNEKSISHDFSTRLHHKNIVEVYEVITDENFIYIIMEYLEGGELFDKIKEKGRLQENLAKRWFKEIVEAVKYIHDVGVLKFLIDSIEDRIHANK